MSINATIEPRWISEELSLAIHNRQLAEHGGGDGVRDIGMLQSALARPLNIFNYNRVTSLSHLAAAYAFGIAKNHPFVDGNKRTALVVALTFLYMNGYKTTSTQIENYQAFLGVANGSISEEELANWLEKHLQKL